MSLSAVEYRDGAKTTWDWKQEYIERLANGDGLEMFSQSSVTADTMLILAGPPRIPDDGFKELLSPIGLITDVNFTSENGLRPMWELGTDQTYFTRGRTSYQLSIGAMVANKPSLMKVLTRQSPVQGEKDVNGAYPEAPDHVGQFWANMDTENTASPFGILMIFKTKGGKELVEAYPPVIKPAPAVPVPHEYPKLKDEAPLEVVEYVRKTTDAANVRQDTKYKADVEQVEKDNAAARKDFDSRKIDLANSAGSFVSAMYLENCNIGNFSFGMNSQAVTMQENISIMFDRMLAVDYS